MIFPCEEHVPVSCEDMSTYVGYYLFSYDHVDLENTRHSLGLVKMFCSHLKTPPRCFIASIFLQSLQLRSSILLEIDENK